MDKFVFKKIGFPGRNLKGSGVEAQLPPSSYGKYNISLNTTVHSKTTDIGGRVVEVVIKMNACHTHTPNQNVTYLSVKENYFIFSPKRKS